MYTLFQNPINNRVVCFRIYSSRKPDFNFYIANENVCFSIRRLAFAVFYWMKEL